MARHMGRDRRPIKSLGHTGLPFVDCGLIELRADDG
jgi:hypothetical protein